MRYTFTECYSKLYSSTMSHRKEKLPVKMNLRGWGFSRVHAEPEEHHVGFSLLARDREYHLDLPMAEAEDLYLRLGQIINQYKQRTVK